MDIEPLWALGGWFIFSNCMAAAATTTKTKTPTLATYTRSHCILFFLAVFFIFLLLTGPAANPIMKPYSTAVSVPIKRILLESSSESESTATMNLHASSTSSSKPSRARFGADEHEVPSGPNPISN